MTSNASTEIRIVPITNDESIFEELGEKYSLIIPKFSFKKIPDKFLFPEYINYLIPLNYYGYQDSRYAEQRLFMNFSSGLLITKKTINEVIILLNLSEEKLTESYLRNLTPYKSTIIPLSENLWRKRVILYKKQTKLIKKINLNKILKCYYYLKILYKLEFLLEELIHFPRLYCINHSAISRIPHIIKIETLIKEQNYLKSIDELLKDVKISMRFITRPFSKPENIIKVLKEILIALNYSKDPLTKYIPESKESFIFSNFIKSKISPIRYCDNSNEPIENLIELTVEMMSSFGSIKEKDLIEVLISLSSRYWFNKLKISNLYFKKFNLKLINNLNLLKKKLILELKPPYNILKIFQNFNFPLDFFKNDKNIYQTILLFEECLFFTTPADIAHNLFQIHLRFSGLIANFLKKTFNDKKVLENLSFFWKLLFIIIKIPNPDEILSFVFNYYSISSISLIIIESLKYPQNILIELLK